MSKRTVKPGSRKRSRYNVFDPERELNKYVKENLEDFLRQLDKDLGMEGQLMEDYRELTDAKRRDALVEYENSKGRDISADEVLAMDEEELKELANKGGKASNAYKQASKEAAYELLQEHGAGREIKIKESTSSGAKAKKIRKEDIPEILKMSRSEIKKWFKDYDAEDFLVNALKDLASGIGAGERVNEIKEELKDLDLERTEKTKEHKRLLFEAVEEALEKKKSAAEKAKQRNLLEELGVSDLGELYTRKVTVPQLKAVAKQLGLKTTGVKNDIADRIANYLSEGEKVTPITKESVNAKIKKYTKMVLDEGAKGRKKVKEALKKDNPDILNLASKETMHALGKELGLESGLSKEKIIAELTGKRTASSLSREARKDIKTDREACEGATLEEVKEVAKKLGVPHTPYMDQAEICHEIYLHTLRRVSELVLSSIGEKKGGLAEILTEKDDKKRAGKLAKLANRVGIKAPDSVDEFISNFIFHHYPARALGVYPQYEDQLREFLESGKIPEDDESVRALAAIFSDVQPELLGMGVADARASLGSLYGDFITRVKKGGKKGMEAISENIKRFRFGITPSKRSTAKKSVAKKSSEKKSSGKKSSEKKSVAKKSSEKKSSGKKSVKQSSAKRSSRKEEEEEEVAMVPAVEEEGGETEEEEEFGKSSF